MKIEVGNETKYSGLSVHLDGSELKAAILAYIAAHDVSWDGPIAIFVNGAFCDNAQISFYESGSVVYDGVTYEN